MDTNMYEAGALQIFLKEDNNISIKLDNNNI